MIFNEIPSHAFAPARTSAHITPGDVNVLIACEESQAECKAFRDLGFNAFSCDIQKCRRGGVPGWHITGDVTPYLRGLTQFETSDGLRHTVSKWDLIIAHPPCTYICRVSSVHMVKNGIIQQERLSKMHEAVQFFYECLNANATYVAVENPIPMARAGLPRPSCYINPSWFGVKYTKKTLYWLRNLPPLFATIDYPTPKDYVRASRGKYRSRTFPQVAEQIAKQWGSYIIEDSRAL